MPESIASRIARILAGTTHALIDKAENLSPEAVMAQSIREIEQVIAEVRVDLGKAEAAKHLILAQIANLHEEHGRLDAQIQTAIAGQRDDLAKAAIGRQTDIEDATPVLQASLDEQSERAKELESHILALLAKKKELGQLLAEYRRHREEPSASPSATPAGNGRQSRVEEAEAAFQRVLSQELGASVLTAKSTEDAAKLKDLVELQRDARIAERLAALKAIQPSQAGHD